MRRALLSLTAVSIFASCGGASTDASNEMARTLLDARFTEDGMFVQFIDVNNDGTADITKYFVIVDESGEPVADAARTPMTSQMERHIVRREIDTNVDGRVDVVRHYDEFEDLAREELDLDFDGDLDCVNTYNEGLLARKEIDEDGDGNVEETRFYRGGGLHRIESDVNDDGRVEQYTYYSAQQLDRLGYDDNLDGEIDRWVNAYDAQLATVAAGEGSGLPAEGSAEPLDGSGSAAAPAEPEANAPIEAAPADAAADLVDAVLAPVVPAEGSGAAQ